MCRPTRPIGTQNDTPLDARVAALAADQHGQVSIGQLRAIGMSAGAIRVRVRNGRLHRRHRGVYSVGREALTLQERFMAAVLSCGDGTVLSHHAAGAHLGLLRWEERHPEVTVPGSAPRRVDGVRVHRSRSLDRRDIIRHDGIWVTSPARTVLDLAPTKPPRALRRIVRQAQVEHRVNVRQLLDMLERANGHHGVTPLRAAIADGATPTRSELEDVVLDLIDTVTSERPEINAPLLLDGEKLVPDFLWRTRRLIVEADGGRYHDNPAVRADDVRKQAILEAHAHRVLRVTWDQAVRQAEQTRARVRAAVRDELRPPRPPPVGRAGSRTSRVAAAARSAPSRRAS